MPLLNTKDVNINIALDRTGTRYTQLDTQVVTRESLTAHLQTPGIFPFCNEVYTQRLRPSAERCTEQHVSFFLRNVWQGDDAAVDQMIDTLVDGLSVDINANKAGTTLRFVGDKNMAEMCDRLKNAFVIVSGKSGDITRPLVNAEMRSAMEYGLSGFIDLVRERHILAYA